MKMYGLGVLVGRFQIIHKGHENMINEAIKLCDKVAVFVGSSQESGTEKNPFTYEERKEMLWLIFGDKISVFPLPDIGVGNNSLWGEYVFQNVYDKLGKYPDVIISAKEARRGSWMEFGQGDKTAELFIPKTFGISASKMREFLLNDDRENWEKYSNEVLWDKYDMLREKVIKSCENKETESI